jgi:hypothetical protein
VIDDELGNILEPEVEGQDEELHNLWETLQENGKVEGELADYLDMDQDLVTGGALTADEIVAICSRNEDDEVNDSPTDEIEIEEKDLPAVSAREASEALQILQRYNDRIGDPKMQKSCDIIDDVLS